MKSVTIPAPDDLLARLTAVGATPHEAEYFYPRVLAEAGETGREMTGVGIANALAFAAIEYTKDFPAPLLASVKAGLHRFVPAFTDDPEVQADALDHFGAVGIPTGRTA